MKTFARRTGRHSKGGPAVWLAGALCASTFFLSGPRADAQTPGSEDHTSGCAEDRLIAPPVRAVRPATGPESVAAFTELNTTDSAFEVIAGHGRILTVKEELSVPGKAGALIAVGDPSILDFRIINTRQIRLIGQRIGTTDLVIITPDNRTYTFEVRIVADLHVLRGQLHQSFPDALIKLSQVRDHIIVEGQARDSVQVGRIVEMVRAYLLSLQSGQERALSGQNQVPIAVPDRPGAGGEQPPVPGGDQPPPPAPIAPEQGGRSIQGTIGTPQIINLLKVPGSQQVLLKVRVAELNRSSLRQIGSDVLVNAGAGNIVGTQIGGNTVTASATVSGSALTGLANLLNSGDTTAFAIFNPGDFAIFFSALRTNSLLKVLAEPNLVTLNGHAANFLAGGEFPVPVATTTVGGGSTPNVQFREFGVRLGFLPTILDNDVIRLVVDPEVSNPDFTLAATLVPGGSPIPGLNTRKAHTVVELRPGQTLAIAGLLQLTMDGNTARIPLLGDLPILGPFFSNTTSTRTEKELLVLVTPYVVEPMKHGQVPPSPGDEVDGPNDLEFYLLNRIEGRTGVDHRATTEYDNRLRLLRCLLRLDRENVQGPHGHVE